MNPPASSGPEAAHDVWRQTRRSPLEAFFAPRNIALIGATDRAGSVGSALTRNLQLFGERIFPVNPKHKIVGGLESYPRVGAIPGRVDLAVIVTPAATVPGLIGECADSGVSSAIIISAGFRETGPAGADLEKECLAEARRGKMRLIGPNCLGAMIPHQRLNATFAEGMAKPGSVAFLSQSGALCSAVLDWSFRENVGFSAFVSVGSMLDVGWGDLITHFGDDPHTKSIVCYMESAGDARAFLSAAREVSLTKPIIILKVGRTEASSRAAASHTGALTGSDAVLDAAFRRAGALRVDTIGELFSMAELLGKQPRPRGPRLAIVTNAGGPGALATDALVTSCGRLAELSAGSLDSLNQMLASHWSHRNPIDVLGDADAATYGKATAIAQNDPQADGVLVILTPQAMTDERGTAEAIQKRPPHTDKPLLACWMGGAGVAAGRASLNAAGIPTFDFPDTAARAFALMWTYADNLRSIYETPTGSDPSSSAPVNRVPVDQIILSARKAGRRILTEVESKQILSAYGIPVVETLAAFSEEEAVEGAVALGFPVVVKLLSETITHKANAGGVHLDVRNPSAVRRAWSAIKGRAGQGNFLGVTVQPMVRREGYELILGSSVDQQFGPVLLFGAGGRLVEFFQDRALGLPPLNATLARRLMEKTKIFAALKSASGRKAVDLPALEHVLARFSEMIADQPWVAEADVNPLLVSSEGILALDARVVLHPSEMRECDLPRPAIRPYPARYITPRKLRDGTPVTFRPIRAEDEPMVVKFHQSLSERSVRMRYFTMLKLDQRVAHERLSRICFIDYDREMALVVERRDTETHEAEILGIGRLSKLHGRNEAEFALIVSDQCQGHGLGTQLLNMLVQIGRDERLERITATMLSDNCRMHRLARKAGFEVGPMSGGPEYRAELVL